MKKNNNLGLPTRSARVGPLRSSLLARPCGAKRLGLPPAAALLQPLSLRRLRRLFPPQKKYSPEKAPFMGPKKEFQRTNFLFPFFLSKFALRKSDKHHQLRPHLIDIQLFERLACYEF